MPTIEQTIRLTGDNHYGCKAPPALPGTVLRMLPDLVKQSVLMAFEGQTMPHARPPAWPVLDTFVLKVLSLPGVAATKRRRGIMRGRLL